MRLIDADAFAKTLRDISKRQKYEELLTKKDGFPTVADVIEAICQDLDGTAIYGFKNAPTVELRIGRMTNGIIIPIERPTLDNPPKSIISKEELRRQFGLDTEVETE